MGERAKIIVNEYIAKKMLYKDNLDVDKLYSSDLRILVKVANKEIERLHSIIKEVREEIKILVTNSDIVDYQAQKLFQILDKVEESK